jgi:hypothetical protein
MPRTSILLGAFSAIPFIGGWAHTPRRVRDALARLEKAKQAEQAAIRRIRLISQDLRTIGLNLQGIADNVAWIGPPFADNITVVAATVFDMADDLHEFTMQADPAHVLNDEQLNLTVLLDGALSDVAKAIRPGRREWRIGPSVSPTPITADRRALRYVLTRVLIVVVRGTAQDGVIDIAMVPRGDGLALVIEAVGGNQAAQPAGSPSADDANAIDARLALAHTLMQAHGGRLELEQRPGLGARATVFFPSARLPGAGRSPR